MTYIFDAEKEIIHLKASGVLVRDDPINYFRALSEDPSFKGPAEERIYFINLDDIAFSYTDIENIRTAFDKLKHGERISNGIFIVDSDFTYGMARMIIGIFEPIFEKFEIERVG